MGFKGSKMTRQPVTAEAEVDASAPDSVGGDAPSALPPIGRWRGSA